MNEATEKAIRNAAGDYRPDDNVKRFPEWKDAPQRTVVEGEASISGLLKGWRKEHTTLFARIERFPANWPTDEPFAFG